MHVVWQWGSHLWVGVMGGKGYYVMRTLGEHRAATAARWAAVRSCWVPGQSCQRGLFGPAYNRANDERL